jgi:hypothetical protein
MCSIHAPDGGRNVVLLSELGCIVKQLIPKSGRIGFGSLVCFHNS